MTELKLNGEPLRIVDLPKEADGAISRMPFIHRILLENLVRCGGDDVDTGKAALRAWLDTGTSEAEIPFLPNRVLMHDTTCGPALVDIAGMRSALAERGIDPALLNPVVRVDVSTDHSVAVDAFGSPGALQWNLKREYERNAERYRFMKWATNTLDDFHVHPPGTGIMHTLNMERLATVATRLVRDGITWAAPDTLIGTDSHTPMINGIGVLAWGVGGLEAESVLFGMPVTLRIPDIVGVKLKGRMRDGALSTDLALVVTHRLRQVDLQDKFVEFFGPGVSTLTAGDRAVVANMTPEFGGNSGYFPIDDQTLEYLRATGRRAKDIQFVEDYAKRVGLWFDPVAEPRYTSIVEIDLGDIEPSLAGPSRPQDRVAVSQTRSAMRPLLARHGAGVAGAPDQPNDLAVAIAAITSCTNTTDPRLLVAAGLLARKARAYGLKPAHWVKTSLAPGSPTAERYLTRAGLLEDLEALGFGIVGYGCTTCIGNSGPLPEVISEAMADRNILPVAVLSGNRNFPGRVNPQLEAGFLASPPMVIGFALAGTVDIDILNEPIGTTADGQSVTLAMVWPSATEIDAALATASSNGDFDVSYDEAEQSIAWKNLKAPTTALYPWDASSTYLKRPPFADFGNGPRLGHFIAHPIMVLGDDVTTDHISPAGAIAARSEAGRYLIERGDNPTDLNVFSARRGNWEAMVRGLFTNKTVENLLLPQIPPGSTIHAPSAQILPLPAAAEMYRAAGDPVVLVAGERYGMGSSRDWAAKGVALLGVRAVLASSFERIHRWNLIGMGILPLRLPAGIGPKALQLQPGDRLEISAVSETIKPRGTVLVVIRRPSGQVSHYDAMAAIETTAEISILRAGGILPLILEKTMSASG